MTNDGYWEGLMKHGQKNIKLNAEETQSVKEVVNFVLQFEAHDYIDWLREAGVSGLNVEQIDTLLTEDFISGLPAPTQKAARNHICYHAAKLFDTIEEQEKQWNQ
tara:strand:- start:1960 stop:2274 length:315 start_codon:yes stop_codon:yes gene_type:complete